MQNAAAAAVLESKRHSMQGSALLIWLNGCKAFPIGINNVVSHLNIDSPFDLTLSQTKKPLNNIPVLKVFLL